MVVVPIPTECLLTEVLPSVISNALTVAIPVTRSPSLAVITPTESIFVTSSYVNTPPTPRLPPIVAFPDVIILLFPTKLTVPPSVPIATLVPLEGIILSTLNSYAIYILFYYLYYLTSKSNLRTLRWFLFSCHSNSSPVKRLFDLGFE